MRRWRRASTGPLQWLPNVGGYVCSLTVFYVMTKAEYENDEDRSLTWDSQS